MWKVSWLYEKVHNIANFWGGYAAILVKTEVGIKICTSIVRVVGAFPCFTAFYFYDPLK